MKGKFPVFWVVILVFGVVWLLNELSLIQLELPWFPVVLIIIAIGAIFNRFND